MKKLNKIKISILLVLVSFLFGCKSVPQKTYVEPLSLLDNESFFYASIPSNVDPELLNRILVNNIQSLSEKDANLISERIHHVYCGLIKNKQGTQIQASIKADVPSSFIPKIFTKKNGWENNPIQITNSEQFFNCYSNGNINISFPSSNIVCLGRGMKYMLNTYEVLSNDISSDVGINVNKSELPDNLYNYLLNATDKIRFYANKPQSFLSVLTGASLDLKLIQIYGSFVVDSKHESQYILDLHFDFKNEKYLRAGKGLLFLAFGLTNGQIEVLDSNKLVVKGIKIKKEQLYKILTIGV